MRRRLLLALAAAALTVYAVFLFRSLSYAAGGPDTAGYLNQAQLIADGRMTRPVELVRVLGLDDSWLRYFMPLGFAPSPRAAMHPIYPPGAPMHLALAGRIGGWKHAPFFVGPLAAIGCVIVLFAIGRKLGLSFLSSLAAAAILGAAPPLLWHAVQPASDVLATFWALTAIWCALQAAGRIPFAVLAGAAFAIGVWVRPTNALAVLALGFALGWRPKLLASAAAGALPFALALMAWNATLHGGPLRTGYGSLLAEAVSWRSVARTAPQYVEWLARMFTPIVFPAGLLVLFDRRTGFRIRWMLVAWFAPFFVFYCFYGYFDGWMSIRFLLPALPALILGALMILRSLRPVFAVALTLWMCIAPVRSAWQLRVPHTLPSLETNYPRFIDWAERHLPEHSIVVTGALSGAFLYYSDRSIVRYDQLDDERFQLLRAYAGTAGLPWYAVVGEGEIDEAGLEERFRGNWTEIDRLESVAIYRLDS